MGSYNFRLSLKGLILRQELFLVSILWVHYSVKHVFTVDSVPAVSRLWPAWFLVVSGLFLNILTNFLSSEGDSLGLPRGLGKVVTHEKNILTLIYSCLKWWSCYLQLFRIGFWHFCLIVFIFYFFLFLKMDAVQLVNPGKNNSWKQSSRA